MSDNMTAATALEYQIRANRLIDLPAPWSAELVFPHYGGLSILNLTHTVADLLGAPLPESRPLLPEVWDGAPPEGIDRVVLIIVDGLGYRWLARAMAGDPSVVDSVNALSGGRGPLPITSVAPSTTSTALTTFWTGASGAAHGITGFRVYLRELDMLTIPLFFKPMAGTLARDSLVADFGVDPQTFVPVPGFAERLARASIPTHALVRSEYIGSALTTMLQRGVAEEMVVPHAADFDQWLRLRKLLEATRGQRCYINAYLPGVDTTSHYYGASSEEATYVIKRTLAELAAVLSDASLHDGRTLVLVTADHGHYNAPDKIDIGQTRIGNAVRGMLSGEARLAFANLRSGHRQAVIDVIESEYADRLTWLDSMTALQIGLFGPEPPYAELQHRIGDLILIPRLGTRLDANPPKSLISVHGGLSDWEMLVPLLWQQV